MVAHSPRHLKARPIRNHIAFSARGRGRKLAASTQRLLMRRLGRAMRAAGLAGVELSLSLSDDRELHALNRRFADEDHATDVLSFRQADGLVVPGATSLGDIVISVEYADRQAREGGKRLAGELFHLAVHGLVHLLGYDHRDAAEEKVMFGYETALRRSALAVGPPAPVRAPRARTARRGR